MTQSSSPSRPEETGFLVSRLFHTYISFWRRELHNRNIGRRIHPGMIPIMLALFENDGRIIKDIAREVQLKYSTMSGMLQRMAKHDLVRMDKSPDDGRASCVYLTDSGRMLQKPLQEISEQLNDILNQAIDSPEDLRLGTIFLRKLQKALRESMCSRGGAAG